MSVVLSPHAPTVELPVGVSHIDGKPAAHPDDGELLRLNPATGTPLGTVALAGETGVDHAVAAADSLDYTVAEPYGVVAAIVPFNGPLIAASIKLAPALAAGNTVVLKPS